jgi:hypothetical protein
MGGSVRAGDRPQRRLCLERSGLISRGHLYKILSNLIYVGRLSHKGQVYDGQHAAIIDAEMWDRVQRQLASHTQRQRSATQAAEAWLAGKLYDDRGSRMSPTKAAKGGRRWGYYVSQAILQGRRQEAGSIAPMPAAPFAAAWSAPRRGGSQHFLRDIDTTRQRRPALQVRTSRERKRYDNRNRKMV